MRAKINIKKLFIKKGRRSCAGACPIALGLLARFKKAYQVSATPFDLEVKFRKNTGLKNLVAQTPKSGRDFIWQFDNRGRSAVKPFSFVARFRPATA